MQVFCTATTPVYCARLGCRVAAVVEPSASPILECPTENDGRELLGRLGVYSSGHNRCTVPTQAHQEREIFCINDVFIFRRRDGFRHVVELVA